MAESLTSAIIRGDVYRAREQCAPRALQRTVQGNKKGSRSCLGYRVRDRLQVAAGVFAGLAAALPRVYFCLNRSTRPAVSTIFWRPV